MNYQSSPVIKKLSKPVLTYRDIPYKAALIFNAGVAKFGGRYVMVFRNDYGSMEEHKLEGTNIGLAYSDNGIDWKVEPKPCYVLHDSEIRRAYDPRLTVIDGRCYMCFAVDTNHGLRGGIAVTDDFDKFEILSLSAPDNRNMVLFPEKVGGYYCRLERPMPVYSRGRDRFDTWLSYSPDFRFWGDSKLVLTVEDVPFANDKVGPGAPPIKTEKGWLATFHGVIRDESMGKNGWEASWKKKYYAGIMLLDLDDPSKVIGMSKEPLIATDQAYEVENGFRCDVIFPGGMLLEDSGEVKIYYGASDTYECMATADVNDLLKLCLD